MPTRGIPTCGHSSHSTPGDTALTPNGDDGGFHICRDAPGGHPGAEGSGYHMLYPALFLQSRLGQRPLQQVAHIKNGCPTLEIVHIKRGTLYFENTLDILPLTI